MLTAIDCQGFAGGMTLGIVQSGFTLVGKREMEAGFGVANCEANRHLLGDHWETQTTEPERWQPYAVDLVFGNPPCSGFSVMSPSHFRGVDSKINHCMWAFSNFVARCQPTIAIMESVRSAYSSGHSLMTALRDNVEAQTGLRYTLHHVYQNALDLGGAAKRPRYFMVLSRVPFGVEYPELERTATVRDVIGDLDDQHLTWDEQFYSQPPTWWSADKRQGLAQFDGHQVRDSTRTRRGIELLLASGEWPAGKAIGAMAKDYYEQHGTLPPGWLGTLESLKARDFYMGFPTTSMLRWHADQPARVVTGDALEQVIHPWLPRMITHREAARVMGFPDDWLIKPILDKVRGRDNAIAPTWGKGVTVQCGEWIGHWARQSIAGQPGSLSGVPAGDREFFIDKPKIVSRKPAREEVVA